MIKTLIFDYDGTLHNTAHLYGEAFRMAYSYLVGEGLAPEKIYTDEETSIYLGMSAPDMWEAFMPDLAPDIKKKCAGIIGSAMDEYVYEKRAILFDNVPATLSKIKERGYHMVILSNCRMAYMDAHREVFSLDEWFEDYYEAERYDFIPKEEIFPFIADKYPGEYMVIGDRDKDLKTAFVHGLKSVACDYGFAKKGELDGADYHIKSFDELLDIL